MLILLRHGQSVWNHKNRFTGWVDIPLSEQGIQESFAAGEKLKSFSFTTVFTSKLIRAEQTAMLALTQNDKIPYIVHEKGGRYSIPAPLEEEMLPVYLVEALNERHYGELQGLDKDEMREKYGKEQVQIWRRSFDVAPPGGESLKLCSERTLPWFYKTVPPLLEKGEKVLIVAHGNSIRSIMMGIKNLSKEEIVHLEIATGEILSFSYKNGTWHEHQL